MPRPALSKIAAMSDSPVIMTTLSTIDQAVQMMHVMDDTGNIDLDRLYNIARPKMDGQKLWSRSAAFHWLMFSTGRGA